jgi:hypothetical protein
MPTIEIQSTATGGVERFTGETDADLVRQLATAKRCATEKIAVQAEQIEVLTKIIELLSQPRIPGPPSKELKELIKSLAPNG